MKKIYLTFTVMLTLLAVETMPVLGQGDINLLFIGRGSSDNIAEYQSDQDLFDAFEDWGYNVTYMSNDDYGSADETVYDGYDAVFMNESVDSEDMTNFGTRDNYPLPIITLEGYCASDNRWGWLEDSGTELLQTESGGGTTDELSIVIKDSDHYITADFLPGSEIAWSEAGGDDIAGTRPVSIQESTVPYDGKLATIKAHDSEEGFWNLVTIDAIAPSDNKVVFWGLNHTGLNGADQAQSLGTDEFYQIVERAAEWAFLDMELEPDAVHETSQDKFKLASYPNPASDKVTLRFRTESNENVRISLHDITGSEVATIANKQSVVGNNFVSFDASGLATGVYLIKLEVGSDAAFEKLIVQ